MENYIKWNHHRKYYDDDEGEDKHWIQSRNGSEWEAFREIRMEIN